MCTSESFKKKIARLWQQNSGERIVLPVFFNLPMERGKKKLHSYVPLLAPKCGKVQAFGHKIRQRPRTEKIRLIFPHYPSMHFSTGKNLLQGYYRFRATDSLNFASILSWKCSENEKTRLPSSVLLITRKRLLCFSTCFWHLLTFQTDRKCG